MAITPPSDSITSDQLGRFYKRVNKSVERSMRRACAQTAKLAKKHAMATIKDIKPYAPIDQRILLRGYKTSRLPNGARLENTARHAVAHEFGNTAYTPPFEKILQWASRKAHKMPALKKRKPHGKDTLQGKVPIDHERQNVSGAKPGTRSPITYKKLKGWRKRKAMSLAGGTWMAIRGLARKRYIGSGKLIINGYAQGGQAAKKYHAKASQHFPALFRKQIVNNMQIKAVQTNRFRTKSHIDYMRDTLNE